MRQRTYIDIHGNEVPYNTTRTKEGDVDELKSLRDLVNRLEFIVAAQDKGTSDLIKEKKILQQQNKELQDKVDDLYIQLASYTKIPKLIKDLF